MSRLNRPTLWSLPGLTRQSIFFAKCSCEGGWTRGSSPRVTPGASAESRRPEHALAVNFQEVVHSAQAVNADVAKPQRFAEDRMDTHKNARLTPKGREEMVRAVVDGGMSKAAAARKFNTTPNTVGKWVKRYLAEGVAGLRDRSSRPLSSPDQTPQATCDAIEVLRRQRYTGTQIARQVGVSPATVSRVLRRRW